VSHFNTNEFKSKKRGRSAKQTPVRSSNRSKRIASVSVVVKEQGTTASGSTKKTHGRPPKHSRLTVSTVQAIEEENEKEAEEEEQEEQEQQESPVLKKPRGRPPKRRSTPAQRVQKEIEEEEKEESIVLQILRSRTPRNRVVEPKPSADESKNIADKDTQLLITPKRGRGRPPKQAESTSKRMGVFDEEDIDVVMDPKTPVMTNPKKRGVGRSRKHQDGIDVQTMPTIPNSKDDHFGSTAESSSSASRSSRSNRVRHGRIQKTQDLAGVTQYRVMRAVVKELVVDIDLGNGAQRTVKLDFQNDVKDNGKRLGFIWKDM
jgi:hypothetical protein